MQNQTKPFCLLFLIDHKNQYQILKNLIYSNKSRIKRKYDFY